jgi:hypothetical protein
MARAVLSLTFSMGKFLQCKRNVKNVNALLKVSLALNNSAASSSLILVGTCDARSRSRIDTAPLLSIARPFLLVFLFFDDAVIITSGSLCVLSSPPAWAASASREPPQFFLGREIISIIVIIRITNKIAIIVIMKIIAINDNKSNQRNQRNKHNKHNKHNNSQNSLSLTSESTSQDLGCE